MKRFLYTKLRLITAVKLQLAHTGVPERILEASFYEIMSIHFCRKPICYMRGSLDTENGDFFFGQEYEAM